MNILDILKRYTDENHRLSQKEIQDIPEREYDMTVERKAVKRMLQAWEIEAPGRIENIFRALTRVEPSQLADPALFDFSVLGLGTHERYPAPPRPALDE